MRFSIGSLINNSFWIAIFIGVFFHAVTFGFTASWVLVFFLFGILVFNTLTLLFPLFYLDIEKQDQIVLDPETDFTQNIMIKHRFNRVIYLPYLSLTLYFDQPKLKSTVKRLSFYQSSVQMAISLNGLTRGVYRRPDLRLKATDFFNIFIKSVKKRLLSTIYVLPKLNKEATNLLLIQHLAPVLNLKKKDNQRSFELHKLKEYAPGDNTKLIDWKTTSKTQTLTIKELEFEKKKETYFIFCGSEGPHYEFLLSVFYTLVTTILNTSFFGVINQSQYQTQVKQVDFAIFSPDNRNKRVLFELDQYVPSDSNKVIFIPSFDDKLLSELQQEVLESTLIISVDELKNFIVYQSLGGTYEKI
jgi:hypothetical protein